MSMQTIKKQHDLIFDSILDMFSEGTECSICDGEGEIPIMSRVYANEPHMADLDTEPCICQIHEPDPSDEYRDWRDNQY